MRIFQTIAGWFSGWRNAHPEYFEITNTNYLNKFIERLLDEIRILNNDKVRLQSELRQVKAELAGVLEDNKTGQAFFAAVMEGGEDSELVKLKQQLENGKDESLARAEANAKKIFGKTKL